MPEPLISLVISTYKRAALLAEALESVANSRNMAASRESIEVIVVDNNSQDDTAETVARVRKEGFPFSLKYVLETKQGISAARNCGIHAARGEFVVFMDDDQKMEEHYLSLVEEQFETTQATCICGPIHYYNAENLPAWLPPLLEDTGQFYAGDKIKAIKSTEIELHGGNMAFRRDALVESGGFNPQLGRIGEQLIAGEEPELQARLEAAGKTIMYTPALVQYHYLRPDRLTKKYWRRHYFDYGRTLYRRNHAMNDHRAKRLAGVPRWLMLFLLRKDIPPFAGSLIARDESARLSAELDVWFRLGQIKEARSSQYDSPV